MPGTQRQIQDYVDAHFPPERVRVQVGRSVADHRVLLAKLLAKRSAAEAVDATIRGLTDLRVWQDRLGVA